MTLILECQKVVGNRSGQVENTVYRVLKSTSDDPSHAIPETVTVFQYHDTGRVVITVGKQPIPEIKPPAPPPEPQLSLYPETMVENACGVRLRFKQASLPNPHSWNVFYGKLAVGFMHGPQPSKIKNRKIQTWACKIALSEVVGAVDRWQYTGRISDARKEFCRRLSQVMSVAEIDGVEPDESY